MLAAYAKTFDADDPLAGLCVGELPMPEPEPGWCLVRVRAASLNHHDVWSLRGVGLREEQLPMILGCDACGVDPDGNGVIVHGLIGDPDWRGDETLDPQRSLLSERYPGTFAEYLTVPRRNLIPKPPSLSDAEAACLPTAWLTAFRMLFTAAALSPGQTVLVQGATGGVASAAIGLAKAAGVRTWATSRSEQGMDFARRMGADDVFASGDRLPERVDAVIETVGEATWGHSLRSLQPGGTVVVAGATTGHGPPADLNHVFFRQLRVVGSSMGTLAEFHELLRLLDGSGLRPPIDSTFPLAEAGEAISRMIDGTALGKMVLCPENR